MLVNIIPKEMLQLLITRFQEDPWNQYPVRLRLKPTFIVAKLVSGE